MYRYVAILYRAENKSLYVVARYFFVALLSFSACICKLSSLPCTSEGSSLLISILESRYGRGWLCGKRCPAAYWERGRGVGWTKSPASTCGREYQEPLSRCADWLSTMLGNFTNLRTFETEIRRSAKKGRGKHLIYVQYVCEIGIIGCAPGNTNYGVPHSRWPSVGLFETKLCKKYFFIAQV